MGMIICLITLLAGTIQGITGFGAGIVMMMVLPSYFTLPQSAGIAGAIGLTLALSIAIRYRQNINYKPFIIPSIFYLVIASMAIKFSKLVDQNIAKMALGIFFVILSLYYLFLNKNEKKLGLFTSILCIIISAICDGLFGIGGPLMVVYFLNHTKNNQEYLVNLQFFFFATGVYNTCFRIFQGIIQPQHFIWIIMGIISIVIGGTIGNKLADKMNEKLLRKLIYLMIGLAGIVNIINVL